MKTTWIFSALVVAARSRRRVISSGISKRRTTVFSIPQRKGVTLVEILVCLGIISLLLALLSPAIQASRERSRAISCANNFRQIGLAMHAFESSHGQFPPMATREIQPIAGPFQFTYPVSPHYGLLPYLDMSNLQAGISLVGDTWTHSSDPPNSSNNSARLNALSVPVFLCPSDLAIPGATNYAMCFGTSTNLHTTPDVPVPNSSRQGFGQTGRGLRTAEVTDGLSMTVAFSERLIGAGTPSRYVPSRDIAFVFDVPLPKLPDDGVMMCENNVTSASRHTSFSGIGWLFWTLGGTNYNQILPPNSAIPDCQTGTGNLGEGVFSARSLHPSGCYILLGDGAVRFVNQSIDESVWRALGTIGSSDTSEFP